jgi:exopolysaccharide biosynthesis operon protein EpsL
MPGIIVATSLSKKKNMHPRNVVALCLLLCASPRAALAFDPLNTLQWPSSGFYPAYPVETEQRAVRYNVSAGVLHDSNLFRLSDNANASAILGTARRSENVAHVGAGVTGDLPSNGQNFLFDARVDDYQYDHFGGLDYAGYNAGAAWKWRSGEQWSGSVGARSRLYQASFTELQAPIKDLITENSLSASANYALSARWRARGGFDVVDYQHGNAAFNVLDTNVVSFTAGVDYVTPAENSAGAQVKYSEGRYPNSQPVLATLVDNRYQELETSAVAHWNVTGKSLLDGRLGYTNRRYENISARDFSGLTGRADWNWFVGAKTVLGFAAWREVKSYEDVAASYVVTKGVGFGPGWAPTSKLVFQARLLHENLDFRGDPGIALGATPERQDRFRGVRLAAGYTPTRNIEVSLGLDKGKRDSNTLGRDYDYSAASANVRLGF